MNSPRTKEILVDGRYRTMMSLMSSRVYILIIIILILLFIDKRRYLQEEYNY